MFIIDYEEEVGEYNVDGSDEGIGNYCEGIEGIEGVYEDWWDGDVSYYYSVFRDFESWKNTENTLFNYVFINFRAWL